MRPENAVDWVKGVDSETRQPRTAKAAYERLRREVRSITTKSSDRELSDAIHVGMDLPHLPWGAAFRDLLIQVVPYVESALLRIDALHKALDEADASARVLQRDYDVAQREIARLQEVSDRQAAAERELRQMLASAHDAAHRRADEQQAIDAKVQSETTALQIEMRCAVDKADAWRTSAEATARTLEILRTALRIPSTEESGLVLMRNT